MVVVVADIVLTGLSLDEASNAMISAGTYLNATSGTTSETVRAQVRHECGNGDREQVLKIDETTKHKSESNRS